LILGIVYFSVNEILKMKEEPQKHAGRTDPLDYPARRSLRPARCLGSRGERGSDKPMVPEHRLQPTRYPITNLELILFILVVTFIVLAFLCISLPLESV
jgi:hypothetical protein